MRGLLLVPVVFGGMMMRDASMRTETPPAREAPMAAGESWAGIWLEKNGSALLRLEQVQGNLSGEYIPSGDVPILCRFKGVVEGATARFDVTLKGKLWHCTLERKANTAILRGRKDLNALFDDYGKDQARLPNGSLLITPRSAKTRKEDEARLKEKRQEMVEALKPVVLGTFERIEVHP